MSAFKAGFVYRIETWVIDSPSAYYRYYLDRLQAQQSKTGYPKVISCGVIVHCGPVHEIPALISGNSFIPLNDLKYFDDGTGVIAYPVRPVV